MIRSQSRLYLLHEFNFIALIHISGFFQVPIFLYSLKMLSWKVPLFGPCFLFLFHLDAVNSTSHNYPICKMDFLGDNALTYLLYSFHTRQHHIVHLTFVNFELLQSRQQICLQITGVITAAEWLRFLVLVVSWPYDPEMIQLCNCGTPAAMSP